MSEHKWADVTGQVWLRHDKRAEDVSIFREDGQWVITMDRIPNTRIAGPFQTLDAAKAAYLLFLGT